MCHSRPLTERSFATNTSDSATAHNAEMSQRLQSTIIDWHKQPRGQELTDLHIECIQLAGRQSPLIPLRIRSIQQLASDTLNQALQSERLTARFYIRVTGNFDTALVASDQNGRFLFFYNQELALKEQIGLYGHAIAHLLHHDQMQRNLQRLHLRASTGSTHIDRLEDLRYTEIAPAVLDRDVMQAYPHLAKLLEAPAETMATLNIATQDLRQRLRKRGWYQEQHITAPYMYTAGRVIPDSTHRGKKLTIDALLRIEHSLPVATVYKQRPGETPGQALTYLKATALRLSVPFAYLLDAANNLTEFNWLQGNAYPQSRPITDFPLREELANRWFQALQLQDALARKVLTQSYRIQHKLPRYYQEAAINNAAIAVLQAQRNLRDPRALITLATGTGKTMVAFQLLWKLKQTGAIRKALFLADRTYLLNQAKVGEFAPFKDAIAMGGGEIDTTREIIFASYQWLTQTGRFGLRHFEEYEPDFFDVIVIDECHRGSASENSSWRAVLDHFKGAIHVGMTATPLKTSDVQTRDYFQEPVYTYSLSRGITDGFLAPYQVRRILLGSPDSSPVAKKDSTQSADNTAEQQPLLEYDEPLNALNEDFTDATGKVMRSYTSTIAAHLANYLQYSEPRAKTMVFCVDNNHAAAMRDELQNLCTWLRPGDIVRIVDEEGDMGKNRLEDFCRSQKHQPVIVTTSRLLSTGIDAPTCKNIVLARGVGSIVEFKQILGRGTRLFLPQKSWFTLLDYSGAIKHFYDPEFDGAMEVVSSEVLILPTEQPQEEQATDTPETTRQESEPVSTTTDAPLTPSSTPSSVSATGQKLDDGETVPAEEPVVTISINVSDDTDRTETIIEKQPVTTTPEGAAEGESTQEPVIIYPAPTSSTTTHTITSASTESTGKTITETPGKITGPQQPASLPGKVNTGGAPATPLPPATIITPPGGNRQGNQISILGEWVLHLDREGKLREGTIQEFTAEALQDLVKTPQDLRARWIDTTLREEVKDHLVEYLAPIDKLAQALNLDDCDAFDLLLYTRFGVKPLTRKERVARLQATHQGFFSQFESEQLASNALHVILNKYVRGEELEVINPDQIKVPPISETGRPGEIAQAFLRCNMSLKNALQKLQELLYTV